MGLDDVVRSAVATADRVTKSLQVAVSHRAWTGSDTYSKPTYATAVERMAVVDFKQRRRRLPDGREILQVARLTFVGPVEPNGADERREPIDPRDEITLPNGFTGPIADVQGTVDPSTGAPYAIEVTLGSVVGQ